MPRESSRHSAANADGCCYQRQRIVMLLRNACEAETPIRRKDAVGVPRVKGAVISLSRYPTASSECPPPFLLLLPRFGDTDPRGGGWVVTEEESDLEDL